MVWWWLLLVLLCALLGLACCWKQMKSFLLDIQHAWNYHVPLMASMWSDWMYRDVNKLPSPLPDRAGLVAVVTGGGRGMGLHVVRTLVECGYHVVIGVRSVPACDKILQELQQQGYKGTSSLETLDLASQKSVKEFAQIVISKHASIHLLVNNAGVYLGPFTLTEDGFERQLATNFLGHALLIHLLLPALERAGVQGGPSMARIVDVSSCAHYGYNFDFDDIHMKKYYNAFAAYSRSKLAQLMFSRHLFGMLGRQKYPVRSHAAHPGIVATEMAKDAGEWILKTLKTPQQGSVSILHAALMEDVDRHRFISNCQDAYSTGFSQDERLQARLFYTTCEMLGIKEFGRA